MPPDDSDNARRKRILVSSCLLGEKVRYDGRDRRDALVLETLGRIVEFVPVCPEVECGLPVPREPMRLEGDPADPRLIGRETGTDHTGKMKRWVRGKLTGLEDLDLCGYLCKSDSPSCGMDRVRVFGRAGSCGGFGAGIFTQAFRERFPAIPVEEEGRFRDPALREDFIVRISSAHRRKSGR